MDIDFSDAPEKPASEPVSEYFSRTKEYWVSKAKDYCESEQMTLSTRKLEKLASEMCQEAFDSWFLTSFCRSWLVRNEYLSLSLPSLFSFISINMYHIYPSVCTDRPEQTV